MKIHFLSDLHIEVKSLPKGFMSEVERVEADVTVLAGDIDVGLKGLELALQISRPVIYVMGNHEYYGKRSMGDLLNKAREKVAGTHVHLLENDTVVLDGVRFIGATLWTDFSLMHDFVLRMDAMLIAQHKMNDYQVIQLRRRHEGGEQMLTPSHVLDFHQESRAFIERELAMPFEGKTVVVTHHAPSKESIDQRSMEGEGAVRKALARLSRDAMYASHLDHLVERADLWIHGHTHVSLDYPIGKGRVVSNPRGYGGIAEVSGFNPSRIVEV